MKKWECTVCGYIHEGETPPDECPVCGVGPEFFKEVVEKEEKTLTQAVLEPDSVAAEKQSKPSFFRKMVMKHHLHPIAVHTPNGVLPLALIFLAIATMFGLTSFERAAFYSLVFVLINMPFVIVTGLIVWQDRYKGAKTKVFGLKIGGAIIVVATLLALLIWRLVEPGVAASPGRWTYLLICLVGVAGAGISGHFGGKLVFGSRKH
ncbi:MAG: rubredoxin-type Fe(Cys)4 protein [Desulfofustis sp.]|nr:rubredoxin-type Fe(Cys)4 protein [Desulfofustis sp.]